MEKSTIISQIDIPSLNLCVSPRPPQIYSARNAPRPKPPSHNDTKPDSRPHNPRFYNRAIEDNTPPGQIPATARPPAQYQKKRLIEKAKLLTRIRENEQTISDLTEKMEAYQNAKKAKAYAISQEYEENYYKPIQERITAQLESTRYLKFKESQRREIAKMDENPISIRSNQQIPRVPAIRTTRDGLVDRIKIYQKHKKDEQAMNQYMLQQEGKYNHQRVKKSRSHSLDYDIQQHTRFFYGNSEKQNSVGKKFFPNMTDSSRVSNELRFYQFSS